jgi:hypothetical protein
MAKMPTKIWTPALCSYATCCATFYAREAVDIFPRKFGTITPSQLHIQDVFRIKRGTNGTDDKLHCICTFLVLL